MLPNDPILRRAIADQVDDYAIDLGAMPEDMRARWLRFLPSKRLRSWRFHARDCAVTELAARLAARGVRLDELPAALHALLVTSETRGSWARHNTEPVGDLDRMLLWRILAWSEGYAGTRALSPKQIDRILQGRRDTQPDNRWPDGCPAGGAMLTPNSREACTNATDQAGKTGAGGTIAGGR